MSKETVLPKNIRQIGEIRGREKICLEDYVVTYIRKKEQQEEKGYLGIFLGEQQETEDSVYVFIRGILEVPQEEQEGEDSHEKLVEMLQKDRKNYFPDWEVQGCCVIGAYPAARMEELSRLLPEAGKVLYHLQEQEETLYHMAGGQYARLRGYFVFYEQNRKMQEYLADSFPEDSVEKESRPDQAIKSFREKVKEKGLQKHSSMLKLASSFFVIAVLVVGVVAVNRVEDIRAVRNLAGGGTPENESLQEQKLVNGALMADSAAQTGTSGGQSTSGGAGQSVSGETGNSAADTLLMGSNAFWEETFEDVDAVSASGNTGNGQGEQSNAAADTAASDSLTDSRAAVSPYGTDAGAVSPDGADAELSAASSDNAAAGAEAASSDNTGAGAEAVSSDNTGAGAAASSSGNAEAVSSGNTGAGAAASSSGNAEAASSGNTGAGAEAMSSGDTGAGTASAPLSGGENASDNASSGAANSTASSDSVTFAGQSAQEAASRRTQAAYIIKEGDTLADICSKYYGTLDRLAEICEANEISDANLIMPGQKIVLP